MTLPVFDLERLAELGKPLRVEEFGKDIGLLLDSGLIQRTFTTVFNKYSPVLLRSLSRESLESLLGEIAKNPEVREFQEGLRTEVLEWGQPYLDDVAYRIGKEVRNRKDQGRNGLYENFYDEVSASCVNCHSNLAIDRFKEGAPAEFKPEQTLYHEDLASIFSDGILKCYNCGSHALNYTNIARVLVIRDRVENKSILEERVKSVIRRTHENLVRRNMLPNSTSQDDLGLEIARGFYNLFTSVMEGRSVQYPKLYKMFEWIKRENFDIEQLRLWIDNQKREALKDVIFSTDIMPLPYAVIRTRIKTLERLSEKIAELLYGLGDRRSVYDSLGARVVFPKKRDCYSFVHKLKKGKIEGLVIVKGTEKDNLKEARDYGYLGYQTKISDGINLYELQVRTHAMDRYDETHPNLAHHQYREKKYKQLEEVPFQERAVMATVIGANPKYIWSLLPSN